MDRVKFDVSGQMFAISRSLLNAGPDSAVKELCSLESDVIVLDRPPDVFKAILAMYQTGELHIPKTCCPGTFLLEMNYWGLRAEQLATCCFFKLQRFTSQQENLKKFQTNLQLALEASRRRPSGHFPTLNNIRDKIWNIVDFRERNVLSTIYFVVSLLMVLVSICNLAFSTDPNFRRNMTNCERYEYMKEFGMDDIDLVANMLKADCGNATGAENLTSTMAPPPLLLNSADENYDIIEVPVTPTTTSIPEDPREPCNVTVIMSESTDVNATNITISPCMTRLETFDEVWFMPPVQLKRIKIPNFKIPFEAFKILELVTTIYFTLDISFRLISCPSLVGYFTSVVNVADCVALVGVFMNWLLTTIRPREQYEVNWFDLLEYLQMLRSFRLFRLVMSFNISKVLIYSVGQSLKDGFIMVLLLVAGMCTFSICLYIAEDKYTVKTIPDAWYWSVITMTTVGYGDVTPKSPFGRLVACICSVAGVLVFSLTVPLFVNQFMSLYQYAEMDLPGVDQQQTSNIGFSIHVDHLHEKSKLNKGSNKKPDNN